MLIFLINSHHLVIFKSSHLILFSSDNHSKISKIYFFSNQKFSKFFDNFFLGLENQAFINFKNFSSSTSLYKSYFSNNKTLDSTFGTGIKFTEGEDLDLDLELIEFKEIGENAVQLRYKIIK